MEQPKQPNKDYINQSLVNQIASLSMQTAERDAIITEQFQQIQELQSNKEIEEMDKGGKKNGK